MMTTAVGALADGVVGRITASSADAVDAIKGHGDDVAAQLGQASALVSTAIRSHADDAVGRIATSSARAVDAIKEHQNSVAGQLVELVSRAVRRIRRSC